MVFIKNTRQNRIYPFFLRQIYIRRYKYFTPPELMGKETDMHIILRYFVILEKAIFKKSRKIKYICKPKIKCFENQSFY
jgi:hypothetical protein